MLLKKNRADKKNIDKIFEKGKFFNSHDLTFKFILNNDLNTPSISFIVPKSVAKKAVERNHLRRLGYSILKRHLDNFPAGLAGVFVFKKYQDDVLTLENEIKNVLTKIN
jgi:ribonuclease P protein component